MLIVNIIRPPGHVRCHGHPWQQHGFLFGLHTHIYVGHTTSNSQMNDLPTESLYQLRSSIESWGISNVIYHVPKLIHRVNWKLHCCYCCYKINWDLSGYFLMCWCCCFFWLLFCACKWML